MPCWSPVTASAWRATTRSRPTFWPKRWCRSTRGRVHDLHMVQSVLALPEHLDVFERGIASRLDFSFSGPQGARLARLVSQERIEIGAIHTYLELFARYFVDLTPQVSSGRRAQRRRRRQPVHRPQHRGHARHRRGHGVQRRHRDRAGQRGGATLLPRVDIPADWVDFVVAAPTPQCHRAAVHPRPGADQRNPGLMAMMAIKGIYAEYGVQRLNHGIGFDTAAIELLLPTYGESLGLKGKICQHWALNPHPALIPAIEAGWVESVHSFGSELGMEDYVARALRRVLHRARRQHAQQPRVLPGGRPLRLRPVHRLDAADGPGRQQLHGHAGPHRRLRRGAQHGRRRARPAPRQPRLAQGGRPGAPGPAAVPPARRAARSSWCRWSRPSASTCSRPSSSGSTPGRLPSRPAWPCRRS